MTEPYRDTHLLDVDPLAMTLDGDLAVKENSMTELSIKDFNTPFASNLTRREAEEQLIRYNIAIDNGKAPKQVLEERTIETSPRIFDMEKVPDSVVETLEHLCKGPVWDGDLISKTARDYAHKKQWIERLSGWNFLSYEGVMVCISSKILKP